MGQPHDKPSTPANFPAQKHEFLDGFLGGEVKLSRQFDSSYLFILPNNDFNSIARPFPGLLAYGFKHTQHMVRITVLDKRARIRHTIESRLYRHLPFGGEFLPGIVRKKHISPSAIACFNFRLEFVFLHLLWQFSHPAAPNHSELKHFPLQRATQTITPGSSATRK